MSLAGHSSLDRRSIASIHNRTIHFKRSNIPNAESQICIGELNAMVTYQKSGIREVIPLESLLAQIYPHLLTPTLEEWNHKILDEPKIAINHEWSTGTLLWLKNPNKDTSNDRVVMVTEQIDEGVMVQSWMRENV